MKKTVMIPSHVAKVLSVKNPSTTSPLNIKIVLKFLAENTELNRVDQKSLAFAILKTTDIWFDKRQ